MIRAILAHDTQMFNRGDATVKSFGVITKWHKKC